MEKDQLIQKNQDIINQVIDYVRDQDDNTYEHPIREGKWSAGEQIHHLILSNNILLKGLAAPPTSLIDRFGSLERDEMEDDVLEQLVRAGLRRGNQAPDKYVPTKASKDQKDEQLKELKSVMDHFAHAAKQWSEADLSQVQLPHPVFKMMSMRELLHFNILHMEHHYLQIQGENTID